MKRIAFVTTNGFVKWGGSEELWSQAAKRMANLGYSIGVNVIYHKAEAEQITDFDTFANCQVYRRKNSIPLWKKAVNKIVPNERLKWLDFDIRGWLKQFKPDFLVISTALINQAWEWMEVCKDLNIPYATVVQLLDEVLWPYPEETNRDSLLYQSAKAVFILSRLDLKIAKKQLACNLENARRVYNPFSKVSYSQTIDWPSDDSMFRLACVARLGIEHKRQDILLEIMNQKKWRERPVMITLFGEGFHEESLHKLKSYWGLDNVVFGGFSENIPNIWKEHHALVLPTRYESDPLVVKEAMLLQRPCIITNVGTVPELIEDGESGFIAPASTVEVFEQTLERAWQSRHTWKEIGERARHSVLEKIPADPVGHFVEEIERLF